MLNWPPLGRFYDIYVCLKPAVHLHTPNRLIAEFNMGAYEYLRAESALTSRVSVAIATHVKFSD